MKQQRLSTHSLRLSLIAAVFSLFALAACTRESNNPTVATVEAAGVKQMNLTRMVAADAILYPLHQAELTPKVSAPVKKFYVQRGEQVRAGQLLAELENQDLAASEVENKGAFEQASAAYETAMGAGLPEEMQKAELELAAARRAYEATQKQYESRQSLFKEGALPRKDLDQAEVAYVQAHNQYEIAQRHLDGLKNVGSKQSVRAVRGQLAAAQGKYMGAAAMLSYTQIRSPINGVITDRPAFPGEMASNSKPLLTVMDVSQVVARAHIPQSNAMLLKVNDAATITMDGLDQPLSGKVTVVSPALDPNSTTVEVWVQAANPGNRVRPGSSVHVSIRAGEVANALVVPSAAVLTGAEGKTSVMVIGSDGKAHETEVQVGVRQGAQAQILSGLQSGQQVVTTGAYGLPDGTQVRIASASPAVSEPAKTDEKDKE